MRALVALALFAALPAVGQDVFFNQWFTNFTASGPERVACTNRFSLAANQIAAPWTRGRIF